MAIDLTKNGSSQRIIKLEFERKREALLRDKQLDIALEKQHQGLSDFKKRGDMRAFMKRTKIKLKRLRKENLINK